MRLLAIAFAFVAAAVGQAPPGYKTYENKQAPVTFFYPVVFEEMPLPPTEQVLVAKYVLKSKPKECEKVDDRLWKAMTPQVEVFLFDLPAPKTGAAATAPPDPAKGPSSLREAMEAQSRVTSWTEFTERFKQWHLEEDPKKPGNFAMTFAGPWNDREMSPIGYLVKKQEGSSILGVYGFALSPWQKQLQAHVQKTAGSLHVVDEDAGEDAAAAIDRLYASGKYRAVEWRKKARSELARGWKALDTDNYLIVHHSKNDGLIRRIARDIEAMRAFYSEIFPPTGSMDQVAVVRVCRTLDEYHQYGGPPNTGGYWHPGNEELVFFDYSYTMTQLDEDARKAMGDRKLTSDDSLLVLYHEALHQYMHYAIGEFAPHDWFNEGYGDYFSGAVVESTGRVVRIDPSPWRIHLAKDMCEYGEGFIPLKEILEAERGVFYNPARARFFYAGAWSFVFFLKQSKEAAANPQWSKLLQTYYEGVKSCYQVELGRLGDSPDLAKKTVAGALARKAALKNALEGIDLVELEKVWRKWVVDMKDPWPSKRKKHK